ncbi:unnamed protein product [Ceutorhynchus assimilis]|uniref:Uncharacterized protein n=1 Tax=Ceutorhynchus assimilis TaxID=467358 RepID=A0A9N9MCJ2_9CUCU|nr:unnamed protein product [Ceutorhynchus assimilis]
MLRSLIQKLPKLSSTSDYAVSSAKPTHRNCRSLSPAVHRKTWKSRLEKSKIPFSRSISCSRTSRSVSRTVKGCSLAEIQENGHARKLCFSKDYYANNKTEPQNEDGELHWRENPPKESEMVEPPPSNRPENVPIETLEQYELEAARPRPMKNHDLMEAFASKLDSEQHHCHLQPSKMRPFGSWDNYYSPVLLRSTNSLKCPRKLKKPIPQDDTDNVVQKADSKSSLPGTRSFCTASCFANEENPKKQIKYSKIPKRPSFGQQNLYNDYWYHVAQEKKLEFLPPKLPTSFSNVMEDETVEFLEGSTPEMRRQRADDENRRGSINYKLSYSDLIKLKMRNKLLSTKIVETDNKNSGCILKNEGNKMLDAFKNLPIKRSMTTRSKSTLSSKSGNKKTKHKPECEDVCTETVRLIDEAEKKHFPYEPKKCEHPDVTYANKRIFLPSKVKLPVPPTCSARPEYRHCKKITVCDTPRADDCIEPKYKPLPKLQVGPCECIDPPQPTYAPRLEKLNLKFEDPPRPPCRKPKCTMPRADDSNPQKFKKLKHYKPQECACVQPPPLTDVKLKRLPRCEPEEVCRPVRVCPKPDRCPPRADDNLKTPPKKLPVIEGPVCPCVETPGPTIAPPIRRLDLSVPEPVRVCKKTHPCADKERADDTWATKKKKLPKFVPGDCPCEDRPMVDWNLKRLVCDEEVPECEVPDPCNAFPRADWGCWEYEQDECVEVDKKCLEKKRDKCAPPRKPKGPVCKDNTKVCRSGWTTTDMSADHKRKFSNSSINSLLGEFGSENIRHYNSSSTAQLENANRNLLKYEYEPLKSRRNKKSNHHSLLDLIEVLNNLEKPGKRADPLLFKPEKHDKIDYARILETIASTTPKIVKKEPKRAPVTTKKPSVTVSSRAISTKRLSRNSEIDIKKKKDTEAKEKCKKIRPSIKALMCQKPCPRYHVCPEKTCERRPGCTTERVPVCCAKEESPYSAYSDNLPTTTKPFVLKTPQFNCYSPQYGYYPNFKKEFEPIDGDKKKSQADKKKFSTTSSIYKAGKASAQQSSSRLLSFYGSNPVQQSPFLKGSRYAIVETPSKDHFTSLSTQNRTFTTKIFQICRPECPKKVKSAKECPIECTDKPTAPKIVCYTKDECNAPESRRCCYVDYRTGFQNRIRPPFPAFSDCLDEEMEEILTQCPLDREKYLRMQPRFMNPLPKPFTLQPPPPIQGRIDIFKEQKCIREKLCMENEGFTQTCNNFGKPVPLLKMLPDLNLDDCQRIDVLKKLGRWPPLTLKSNRRFSTSLFDQIRNFHVLSKGIDKCFLKGNNDKEKVGKNKLGPNKYKLDKKAKSCIKLFTKRNDNSVAKRVQRFYTTYKINRKRSFGFNRRQLSYKPNKPYRGNRNRHDKGEYKKTCPKFVLKNCPPRSTRRKDCKRLPRPTTCTKPNTPYPAYSECTEHSIVVPECDECAYDINTMENLQPKLPLINAGENINHFPSQEKINRATAWEYYKCKNDIVNEGTTMGCDPSLKSSEASVPATDEEYNPEDREKLEAMCIRECIKRMPCHLPEEEKYCVCKERCQAYFRQQDSRFSCPEEDVVGNHNGQLIDCEQDQKTPPSGKIESKPIDESKKERPPRKIICISDIPMVKPVDCKPESEIRTPNNKVACKPPTKIVRVPEKLPIKIACGKEATLKHVECIKPAPKYNPCKQIIVKAASCPRKPTQLEIIWQRIVNFFKARPNCPEPGEYKRRLLRDKAEKAASALGLVVVDPKCLPQDLLKGLKLHKKDCKACPDQTRSFSTTNQQLRNYSNSCKNLEEINRMLEEDELKQNEPTIAIFPERQDALVSEALKMSFDFDVYNYTDSEWCNSRFRKPYFGYTGVLPSRENILERAWRISIERKYPVTYNFFNEIFTKVDRSVKTYEDLEKLKTDNILRELDELLQNKEPNKKKK